MPTNVQTFWTCGVEMPPLKKLTMFAWPVAPSRAMVCHFWCYLWPVVSVCQNVDNFGARGGG